MEDNITVLIADDNIEFGDLLNKYISHHDDIRVVGIARDGIQALEMIKTLTPDIVVLDIIMPNLDGLGVLEKVSEIQLDKKPLFIVLSAIGQDVFIQRAISLGAEYYIIKPFDVNVLVSRIRQVFREKHMSPFSQTGRSCEANLLKSKIKRETNDIEINVTDLMLRAGIPPHMIGYRYIREAVLMVLNDPNKLKAVTKSIYPEVAVKFNTSSQKVERSIRNAIKSAWTKRKSDFVKALYGRKSFSLRVRPTNSRFIAMMADRVKIVTKIKG